MQAQCIQGKHVKTLIYDEKTGNYTAKCINCGRKGQPSKSQLEAYRAELK